MKIALLMAFSTMLSFAQGWAEAALSSKAQPTPLEQLFAAWFRGPSRVDIGSNSNSFAGRTTLGSGQASVVVSTTNVKSNSLIRTDIEVAVPAAYVVQGQVSIASGANTATASTSAVYSGMNVLLGYLNNTVQNSGFPRTPLRINSLVDGVSFAISTVDSPALIGTGVIGWSIPEAVPQGVKVNTITENGYFTLGWADGRPRPLSVTLMWECKLPGKTA